MGEQVKEEVKRLIKEDNNNDYNDHNKEDSYNKGIDDNSDKNKKIIYLDYAATTPVRREVLEVMMPFFSERFGNPSSLHQKGLEAKEALDNAREKIASLIGADHPSEIIFTSGGTESINLAIKGVALANKKEGRNHIIVSRTEHHAVLHTAEFLESQGFRVTYLPVDKYGRVDPKVLKEAISEETILVSIIYANNEIGTVNNIPELSRVIKEVSSEKGVRIFFHTDACQAGEYLNINVKDLGVDLMTINGSKIEGPKGTGFLYVKRGIRLMPLIHGGAQERRLRAGTENVPGIVGLAKALELAAEERGEYSKKVSKLRDYFINRLLKEIPKSILNGHPVERLPNNVNVSILDIEGESLLLMLNEYGICASSGSACTSETLDPSHVVIATGLPYEAAHSSIRFSLGKHTSKEDVDQVMAVLPGIVERLRAISPISVDFDVIKEEFEKRS